MPRANRHFIPGYIWHITHRCHKKEFLLKFKKDKERWLRWLFEAKKRYGLCILNYMVTSNHVHLLVTDNGHRDTIPKSIQLVAGRSGQEFNKRKKRKGAFWEDRYHATAVSQDDHLLRCIVYMDMNMVRAGVVAQPEDWPFCGYNEVLNPKERYGLIDYPRLMKLIGVWNLSELQSRRKQWVADMVKGEDCVREAKWTSSIAVGNKGFIKAWKENLKIREKGRKVVESHEGYELREPPVPYDDVFEGEKESLSGNNTIIWDEYPKI